MKNQKNMSTISNSEEWCFFHFSNANTDISIECPVAVTDSVSL